MHAMRDAKKKALLELIRQMRKREHVEDDEDAGGHSSPVSLTDEEADVDSPDPTDLEDIESAVKKETVDIDEDDPKAILEQFMKHGAPKAKKTRATVVMAIKDKGSPASKMKKTFGSVKTL